MLRKQSEKTPKVNRSVEFPFRVYGINDEIFRREKAIAIGIGAHLQCKQPRRCFDTKKNIHFQMGISQNEQEQEVL